MAGEQVLVIDDSPTLLRIASRTLQRAGYQVRTAEGGARGVTLAKERRPDVILLDYWMPGLTGEDVCRILGQDAGLRDVPVIVMSSRADQIGERVVETLGAVDYVSKPFSPEILLAVTGHAIHKYVREGTPPPRLTPSDGTPSPAAPAPMLDAAGRPERLAHVRARVVALLGEPLVEALRAGAGAAAQDDAARASVVTHAIDAALTDAALSELARVFVSAAPEMAHADGVLLRVDLGAVAIADVLQLLQIQRATGVLNIARDDSSVEAFFRDGRLDFVAARNLREEFLLGRFIVETGAISHQDLDLFLRSRAGTRKLLGAQLVKLGYITPENLALALRQQSCEVLYEVLRWRSGRALFRQTTERPENAAEARLDIGVEQLLMEGFRRVDAWAAIETVIHSFDIVFARNEEAIVTFGIDALEPSELIVLDLVNGQRSVRDILRESRMGSFEACQLLYRLLSARLVRKRVEPAPSASTA
jgi:CheY-like chemotaxis protein